MENKSISILGLGWLGNFLAKHFIEKGYSIKASTTTDSKLEEFKTKGYEAYLINLNSDSLIEPDFLDSSIHFICIPPSKIDGDYAACISKYISQVNPETIIFFISSTSVYPDDNGDYLEKDSAGHGKMLQAEKIISSTFKKHFILRCSGLFGPDRDPGKFLAGKTNLKGPFSTVNLIHALDICAVMEKLIPSKIYGIYNISVTAPFLKKEFYFKASRKISNAPPEFDMRSESFKRTINTKKVVHLTGIKFDHTCQFYNLIADLE